MDAVPRQPTVARSTGRQTSCSPGPIGEKTIQYALSDHSGAFEIVVERYRDSVYRQARRQMRHQEEVEDVAQEIFLILYRKRHTFRGESSFSSWLYRITMNVIHSRLRKQMNYANLGVRLSKVAMNWAP